MRRALLALVVAGAALGAAARPAAAQKRGSISFGAAVGIDYEQPFDSSRPLATNEIDLARFSYGLDLAIRFRYKLRGPGAVEMNLESQEFLFDGTRTASDPNKLHIDVVSLEYLRYFSRSSPRSRYVLLGPAIITKVEARGADQSQFASHQGLGLVLGAGTELLKGRRQNGIDLSLRAYPFVVNGRYAVSAALTLGLNHYMQP